MASDLQVTISASVKGLIDGLNEATGAVRENTSKMQEHFEGLAEAVEKIKAPFAAAVAALAGGTAFKEAIEQTNEYVESVAKLGRVMGTAPEEASVMAGALKRIGVESNSYELAIYRVQIALRTQEAALVANGIKTRDATGEHRGINDIMEQGIKRVQELGAGYDRNALAQLMFGRSAKELEVLQRLNNERMQEAREQVEGLGMAVTERGVEAMYEYKSAMAGAQQVVEAIGYQMGSALLPVLTELAKSFQAVGPVLVSALVPAFHALAEILDSTTLKLVALAAVARLALWPALTSVATSIVAFAQTLQVQYALGVAEATANSMKFTQALNTTGAAAGQLGIVAGASLSDKLKVVGSVIAGMVNWWLVLAAAIVGAAYAIERYLTAETRAAKVRLEEAEATKAQGERYRELAAEIEKTDSSIRKAKPGSQEHSDAIERMGTLVKQMNNIFPGFAENLDEEAIKHGAVTEKLKEQNAEYEKNLRMKVAQAQEELKRLEDLKAAQDKRNADYKATSAANAAALEGERAALGGVADALEFNDLIIKKTVGAKSVDYSGAIEKQLEAIKMLQKALGEFTEPPKKPDTFVDSNNTGRMQLWMRELEEIKAKEENWFTWSNAREQAFWASKLAIANQKSGEYAGALAKWNTTRRKAQEDAHEGELARLRTEMDDKNRSDEERIEAGTRLVNEELRVHKEGSKQVEDARRKTAEVIRQIVEKNHEAVLQSYKEEEQQAARYSDMRIEAAKKAVQEEIQMHGEGSAQVAAARRHLAEVEKEIDRDRLAAKRAFHQGVRDLEMGSMEDEAKNLKYRYDMGEMNKTQLLQQEKEMLAQRYRLEHEAIQEQLQDQNLSFTQRQELINKDRLAYQKYANGIKEIDRDIGREHMRVAEMFIGPFVSSFERGFQQLLKGQITLSQAIQGLWSITFDAIVQGLAKLVAEWLTQGLKMLANWILNKTEEVAVEQTAATSKVMASQAAAFSQIMNAAGIAGANAAAAVAAIPVVGPAMAPGAMTAMTATVLEEMLPFAAAAGGWDLPSGGPFPTLLHSQEMVLPASLANPIRNAVSDGSFGGGGPMSVAIHLNFMDATGAERVLRRNRSTIVRIAQEAIRDNRYSKK